MKINKKKIQKEYAQKSIESYLLLLKNQKLTQYFPKYIKEILNLSKSFNIRLRREEKLQFCKQCTTPWNSKTRTTRLNPKTSCIEHTCNNCKYTRRFKYK